MSEEVCPICLEPIGETMFLTCDKHSIHIECLNDCQKLDCPICRKHLFDRESRLSNDIEIVELFTDNIGPYSDLIYYFIIFFSLFPIVASIIDSIPKKYRNYVLMLFLIILFSYYFNIYLESVE